MITKNKEWLEVEELFNNLYPKEIRCKSHQFEGGLFKKGFIEGFLIAKNLKK